MVNETYSENNKPFMKGHFRTGTMERRQFILATVATTAVGVAGCLHGDGGGDTSSPEDVVEAYLDAANDNDADRAEDLLHSESRIDTDAEDDEGNEDDSIEVNSVELSEENLDEDAISDLLSTVNNQYGEDAIATIAEQSNAVVEADVTITSEDVEADFTIPFLTAEEDGDWLVVDFTTDTSSSG